MNNITQDDPVVDILPTVCPPSTEIDGKSTILPTSHGGQLQRPVNRQSQHSQNGQPEDAEQLFARVTTGLIQLNREKTAGIRWIRCIARVSFSVVAVTVIGFSAWVYTSDLEWYRLLEFVKARLLTW